MAEKETMKYRLAEAVKALMERLRGSYTGAPREFLIPRRLVVRGSTAQPQRKEQEA